MVTSQYHGIPALAYRPFLASMSDWVFDGESTSPTMSVSAARTS
ncbi:Uncharacterised protein [Mycobacteroides abscessus subsp. abscessus]|nr:Uncharacterised protein [Mycobacteroides abscessus subsp. abscessus]